MAKNEPLTPHAAQRQIDRRRARRADRPPPSPHHFRLNSTTWLSRTPQRVSASILGTPRMCGTSRARRLHY